MQLAQIRTSRTDVYFSVQPQAIGTVASTFYPLLKTLARPFRKYMFPTTVNDAPMIVYISALLRGHDELLCRQLK